MDANGAPLIDENGNVLDRTQLPQSSPRSIADLMQREKSAQEAKEAAERRERDNAARAEHDARVKAYWSQPVDELMTLPVGVKDQLSGLESGQSDPDAGQKFLGELADAGVNLTAAGRQRLAAYLESQNRHFGVAVHVANMRCGLSRLKFLRCFSPGEVTEPSPVIDAPVEQEPNLGELFARANDSPQADRGLRSVIAGMVNAEIREVLWAWQRSVYENFSHKLTELQLREAWRFVQDHNLNPLKPASWDAARRSLVSRSLLSDACLTCREVLERQYREGSISHREFLGRCRTLEIEGVLDKPRHAAA